MASESLDPIERWTAKWRVTLVVSILKGETSVAEAARTHGLTVAEVEDWREKFLLGAENALWSRPRDEVEPYGPPRLRHSAIQGAQSGGTDVGVPQAFPSGSDSVRQNSALLPVVRPARGQLLMAQVNVDRT